MWERNTKPFTRTRCSCHFSLVKLKYCLASVQTYLYVSDNTCVRASVTSVGSDKDRGTEKNVGGKRLAGRIVTFFKILTCYHHKGIFSTKKRKERNFHCSGTFPTSVPLCPSRCVILKATDKTHSHPCTFPRLFFTCFTHRYQPRLETACLENLTVVIWESKFILCDLAICSLKKHFQHLQPAAHSCSVSLHCCFCFSMQNLPCAPFLPQYSGGKQHL